MSKKITFYKLVSPYSEDLTKNCGLAGEEIDRNFLNLKEDDVDSISVTSGTTGNTLFVKKIGGEVLSAMFPSFQETIDLNGYTKDFSFDYDANDGIITISYNGSSHKITGLTTIYTDRPIYRDNTLNGNGLPNDPLSVSKALLTGEYAPCIELIDETKNDGHLPVSGMSPGDRYLTKEIYSPYGWYYNDAQMKKISEYLTDNNLGWRIPTKKDWDAILDASEYCDEYRNHTSLKLNAEDSVGKVAGKRLKTVNGWTGSVGSVTVSACSGTDELKINTLGTDDFEFSVLPAGHADNYHSEIDNFSGCAYFWTNSNVNDDENTFYLKEFTQDLATVRQIPSNRGDYNSIRLVKDMDNGINYPVMQIGGHNFETIVMSSWTPSVIVNEDGTSASTWDKGSSIWTKTNLFGNFNLTTDPLKPNSSYTGDEKYAYYVNYWNGMSWERTELKEGYSSVLLKGLSGDTENEYRVISGNLVNVSEIVYTDVIDRLNDTTFKDVYGKISANTEYIESVDKKIETFSSNTESAEGEIISDIESLKAFSSSTLETEVGIITRVTSNENAISNLKKTTDDTTAHLIKDGKYVCSGGTLTLETNDEGNNIIISLNGNYGLYPSKN